MRNAGTRRFRSHGRVGFRHPNIALGPPEVKLFWDAKTEAPNWRLTTDWGLLDGYHAPGRNAGNHFPSLKPAPWTLDEVESPRNSGWFLGAMAARRALTFLEQQTEVDAERLGVYGHSMGGKLTVLTAHDARVKAAAPSCGGISDRDNASELYWDTLGDDANLKQITCPILFLSPANDFHGRIGDLPSAVDEIQSQDWRVTCSPHHNHQDTETYEVATLLWFDQHLQHRFEFPKTPKTRLHLDSDDGIPTLKIQLDTSRKVEFVDVYYTQHGKTGESAADREDTVSRFWRHAAASESNGVWTAKLPLGSVERPVWVYANASYRLDQALSGAGYYYRAFETDRVNVSSLLETVSPDQLKASAVRPALGRNAIIETFDDGWQKEWFSYRPEHWPRSTFKLHDEVYQAPPNAKLAFQVRCEQPNLLVVLLDDHAAVVKINPAEHDTDDRWQDVVLASDDFRDFLNHTLPNWEDVRELRLSDAERLQPPRDGQGSDQTSRVIGKQWQGPDPEFRNLHWSVP